VLHIVRQPKAVGLLDDLRPWGERVIVPMEGGQTSPLALLSGLNLLAGAVPALPHEPPAPTLACFSGWLPEDHRPERGVFSPSLATWTGEGAARLQPLMDWLADELDVRRLRLALWPHARHVLSDAASLVRFLDGVPGIGFILEPAALLTTDMLSDAEDHLERLADLLDHPAAIGAVVTNIETVRTPDGRREARTCPLHRGQLEPRIIMRTIVERLDERFPLVLPEGEIGRQLAMIRPPAASRSDP